MPIVNRCLVIFFLALMGSSLLAMESKEDKVRNCLRFVQFIQELEQELVAIEKYKGAYKKKWIHPSNVPWDFESRLAERKSQILRDIHYFNGLLATNYCTESECSQILF